MNKKTIITVLLTLVAMAGQGQVHYRLEGNIGNPEVTDTLTLFEDRGKEVDGYIATEIIDTLYIVNGKIIPIEGELPESMLANAYGDNFSLLHIILDNGTTQIEGTIDYSVVRQSGTPLVVAMNQMEEDFHKLTMEIQQVFNSNEPIDTMALIAREDSFVVSVVSAHPCDPIGSLVVNDYGGDVRYFSPKRGLEFITMLDSSWVAKEPKLQMLRRDILAQINTGVGSKFIDIVTEYNGKKQRLSDYVGQGQYVLTDFWASWCGPCREEIPNLIAAYKKYKAKGLVVLGIATWDDPEKTLEAIKKENIPYPQIINFKKSDTDIYGIDGIPEIILFSPDGTILARGLRGNEIDKRLAEIFNDK